MKSAKNVRTLGSKWIKTKALLKNKELRSFIPDTRLFSRATLWSMLNRYRTVYVKPIHGSFGSGVIRAQLKSQGNNTHYAYHHGTKPRTFQSFDTFFTSLVRSKFSKPYLAQKGIPLLKLHGRPFDIRVMVQRLSNHDWVTTGIIGRLAHPKKVVTNYHSQGKPLPLEVLLAPYAKGSLLKKTTVTLERLGVKIARHLQKQYPGFREIGVDIGLDAKLHPWIIEVNTAPDPYIFNQLKDKRMFRTVLRYARANRPVSHKR